MLVGRQLALDMWGGNGERSEIGGSTLEVVA
jgi:hypothetical protein